MSRAKVRQALKLVRDGRLEDALALLSTADAESVRRHLDRDLRNEHLAPAARTLWERLFPSQAAPAPIAPGASPGLPKRLLLENPGPFFQALGGAQADLDGVEVAQIWSIVALATLARNGGSSSSMEVRHTGTSGAARFAHAVGLQEVVDGSSTGGAAEPGRTVKLQRVTRFEEIESVAHDIAQLMLPSTEADETRKSIYLVLVELMRNVVQHSQDRRGGVVAAQLMDAAQHYDRPAIQVAVGDAGIGILDALKGMHPELTSAKAAVEKALRPHISGTFEEGLSGSSQNAGMGLFFISEMAKLTAGRLLLATRSAAYLLQGDIEGQEQHKAVFLSPEGNGFPGTLVAFEFPLGEAPDHAALRDRINERAKKYTPRREKHRWLSYQPPPEGTPAYLVSAVAENTAAAERFAREEFEPRLVKRDAIALDFRNVEVCTQSFLHSLLFEPLRLAWARRAHIHVLNAGPAIRSALELLEDYALGG